MKINLIIINIGDFINRNNFDSHWLTINEDRDYGNFRTIRLEEIEGSRESVKVHLITTIKDHFSKPQRVQSYIDSEKFERLAIYISNRIPVNDTIRKGDFGEIIGTEHLDQKYKYNFPVFKLRSKSNPNSSMPGEDILAFRIKDKKIERLCVGEAKTYSRYAGIVVEEAHERLKKAYKPHPTSLAFISDKLSEDPDTMALAEEIEDLIGRLGKENFPRDNWIFFITGNRPRDPFEKIRNESEVVENLTIVNLHLPMLSNFVNELFDECRV